MKQIKMDAFYFSLTIQRCNYSTRETYKSIRNGHIIIATCVHYSNTWDDVKVELA